jgi:hypothetical protein
MRTNHRCQTAFIQQIIVEDLQKQLKEFREQKTQMAGGADADSFCAIEKEGLCCT